MAVLALIAGATFTAQGLGLVRGQDPFGRSFMVGDPAWAVIGIAMVVASLVALAFLFRRRRAGGD